MHSQREVVQRQSTHIPMQKVEEDALHMDNIHMQRERTRKLHMRPTLKEAKQRQMGSSPMQKERLHMRRETHHMPRDTIQSPKEETPTQRDFKQRRNIWTRTRRDTRHRRFQTAPTRRDITQQPATTLQLEAIAHMQREIELLHLVSTPMLKDRIQLL